VPLCRVIRRSGPRSNGATTCWPTASARVLRRSCAFAGRFTLEDVESVCTSQGVPTALALDLLSSLVDKSLVMREDAGGVACYRLHETMREFAGLKLSEAGEQESVERRCAEYYRSRCLQSAFEGRYRLVEWLAWADLEIDNIRSVLHRSLAQPDFQLGIDLAASLGWYWATRVTTEGMRWLDALLASGGDDSPMRAWGYFLRGFLAVLKADPAAAMPALREAVAASRQADQRDLLSKRSRSHRSRRAWLVITYQPGACSARLPRTMPAPGCSGSEKPKSRGWSLMA
jgi:hypothetical protein